MSGLGFVNLQAIVWEDGTPKEHHDDRSKFERTLTWLMSNRCFSK